MTEQSEALVRRLREIRAGDGSPIYITLEAADLIEALQRREAALKADAERLAERVIRAWETLPEGYYSSSAIQRWLFNDMKPVIDELLATYREKHNG